MSKLECVCFWIVLLIGTDPGVDPTDFGGPGCGRMESLPVAFGSGVVRGLYRRTGLTGPQARVPTPLFEPLYVRSASAQALQMYGRSLKLRSLFVRSFLQLRHEHVPLLNVVISCAPARATGI
jgi:hypothetical protein